MVRGAAKIIFTSLIFSSSALANENANQNVNRFECTGCHGGGLSPNLPATQAFSLIDMDTMGAVTQYEAGKTYRIQIRFNNPNTGPWTNAYVLHIAETSTGAALRAGSIIDSPSIGVVTDGGPTVPQSNARILSSAVKASVDNAELQWQAPNSGTVRFQLLRMETNNSNNTGGDRVSQNLETFTYALMGDSGTPTGDDTSNPPSLDPSTGSTSNDPGFSSDLQAGCGRLQSQPAQSLPLSLGIFVLAFIVLRQISILRHRRSS